jgi:subtilisin family serine protease
MKRSRRTAWQAIACLVTLAFAMPVAAELDPFTLPDPRPASAGAYQYGVEMLRLHEAWALTRGRTHIAIVDGGQIDDHPDLRSGLHGNIRRHLSQPIADVRGENYFHAMLTTGLIAARGFNGTGITGACPGCSVTLHNWTIGPNRALPHAISSGAAVINMSLGGSVLPGAEAMACGKPPPHDVSAETCALLDKALARDMIVVSIAGNTYQDRMSWPANHPGVIPVGGVQPDGKFWSQGYAANQPGSSWGPELRLVAPARDVLTTQREDRYIYDTPEYRCGDRVDSTAGETRSLPESYRGYGDCFGTSFAAPMVSAIAALIRSVDPLLTADEVRAILHETATTPVAGPPGSFMTFHLPDAEAAVARALGPGRSNRVTPVFSLYSESATRHLFTTTPQTAVAAIAGELGSETGNMPRFASFGDAVGGYSTFTGRICDPACRRPEAAALFQVFTTEQSPYRAPLVALYRMSRAGPCATAACVSAFAYATSETGVQALEARGFHIDVVEGYVVPALSVRPANTRALCLAFDAQRDDHILSAAEQCDRSTLRNGSGATTGGSYNQVAQLGYVPDAMPEPANHTALWWNPHESGWGINLAHQDNTLFATLFTHDESRNPLWLVMSEGRRAAGSNAYEGTLYRTTGPPFHANPFSPIGAGNLSIVGRMSVTVGETEVSLDYDVNGVAVHKKIEKMVFGATATACVGKQAVRDHAANYQDLWWNETESGWGLNLAHQGDVLFGTLFTYADDGRGTWVVMSDGRRQADGSYLGDLYRAKGSPFNAQPYVATPPSDITRVGTMRLRFTSGESGTLAYTIDGIAVTKAISRQRFGFTLAHCN